MLICCNITFMLYLVNSILIIIVCLDYHWRRLCKQTFSSAISFAWLCYQRGLLDITLVSSYLHDSKAQNTPVTHNTACTATTENQYGSHSCLPASALESSCISRGSRSSALHQLIQARLRTGNVQSIIIRYCVCTMSLHQSGPWEGTSCVTLCISS